jgi:AcrR family transcriptional regulator
MAIRQPLHDIEILDPTERRWQIWDAAAPLFERLGYQTVTFEQVAAAAATSPGRLLADFPDTASIALYPLARSNGVRREWNEIRAFLPADPAIRLRNFVEFVGEYAADWRLAFRLAAEMATLPDLELEAARHVRIARRDFAAIVASVDPTLPIESIRDLVDATSAIVLAEPGGHEPPRDEIRSRLNGAVARWLAAAGSDPASFLGCTGWATVSGAAGPSAPRL